MLNRPSFGRSARVLSVVLLAAVAATGCGGGGGGTTASTPVTPSAPTPPPTTPTPPPVDPTPPPTDPTPSPTPPPVTGNADLTWTAPTLNEDGTQLTNLAGYRVRYGQTSGALGTTLEVPGAGVTSVRIEGLAAGTWYFTVASYTTAGVESAQAGPVTKVIG